MEFKLITTQKEIERPILFNSDEIKSYVSNVTSQFSNLQYTDDQEAQALKDRADLNKLKEALKKAKKAVKEQNEIPYNVFAGQVDEAIKMLDDTIAHIDKQTKEMDEKRRTEYLSKAHEIYEMTIDSVGFGDWLSWEDILAMKANSRSTYRDVFGNKGTWGKSDDLATAGKKTIDIFKMFIDNIQNSINTVKAINSPFEQEGLRVLKETRSTESALAEMARLQNIENEKQRAIEEAKRQAELKAQREIEEARRRAEEEKRRAIEEEQRKAREEAERQRQAELARVRAEEQQRAREEAEKLRYKPEAVKAETSDTVPWEQPDEELPRKWITFKAFLNKNDAVALDQFLKSRGIKYEPVKEPEKPEIETYGEGNKVFYVSQQADYLVGHLRYGHREGYIRGESVEDVLDKLENQDYTDYLTTEVDSYELEDSSYSDGFRINEIKQ